MNRQFRYLTADTRLIQKEKETWLKPVIFLACCLEAVSRPQRRAETKQRQTVLLS